MIFWGLIFGMYTFGMIWVAAPVRRLNQSFIGEMGLYVQTACDAVIGPVHRAMGQMFSNIRVSLLKKEIHSTKEIQV
jgi:hypothetical protein